MRKLLKLILVSGTVLLTSCGGDDKHAEKHIVFSYNEGNSITSLDPAAASSFENIQGVNQLFNGLVQMNDDLIVEPAIAKKFSISSDGLVYTFDLRTDVLFHDDKSFKDGAGRLVVAQDFVFSFNRLFDAKVSRALSDVAIIDNSTGKGFLAENDSTLKIYLKQPFGAFLNILTMKYFSVIPHEAVEMYKEDFRKNPVGTGPFVFKLWEEGTKLIMHKNPTYFERDEKGDRLPYVDGVSISFIKQRQSAIIELLNEKLDMISGADALDDALSKSGELNEEYTKKFNLQRGPFLKTDYVGILIDEDIDFVKNSPVRLKAIRQAMNYAFDREKMIKFLRKGIGKPATAGFIPMGLKSFNKDIVKGYTYDPDKVRDLLKQAGYPNGEGLPTITLYTTEHYRKLLEYMQSQFAENHIKIEISIEPNAVLSDKVNKSQFLMFKKSWVADYADEENFLSKFYSKNFAPNGYNYFHYKNPKFDKLFEQALNEKNDSLRRSLYQQMDQIAIEDAPMIPMFYDEVVRIVNKRISGLEINPMNLLNLKTVKKAEKESH
ncbi:MAG: ABC transporter substrate-binding protein [Bacteroidia bacterium]|nr:ABC transporter substrate-binding protein [Bacteroidia bacterium]